MLIYLGTEAADKAAIVERYCRSHEVDRVVVVSPEKFAWPDVDAPNTEVVEYTQTIQYAVFYRLLQEVDRRTLVVMNECLRTQDRNDLTYNCIRHFLNQAGHQIIFQYLPIIAGLKDLFILFDFDTKSKWKRERDPSLLREATFAGTSVVPRFNPVLIHASDSLKGRYRKAREKRFAELGMKDPHTIPRNLVLLSGNEKAAHVGPGRWVVGRNKRLKMSRHQTYRDKKFSHRPYVIFEPCHRFIDMADFMCLSEQTEFDYMLTDLKVERWYLDRYQKWAQEIAQVHSVIQQNQERS